jgi:flagellar protein FliL
VWKTDTQASIAFFAPCSTQHPIKVIDMRFFIPVMVALLVIVALPSQAEEKAADAPVDISYYPIKPSLVANLASGGKYIRCDIQLMSEDSGYLEKLRLHDPAIRHTLLLLLSEQDGNAIKSPEGKEALRKKALAEVNRLLKKLTGKEGIKALFFTTFFVQ